jgi:subfamily B ATP-binding cassette protein MsbA
MADLLERFYDPTSGIILLDGQDIRDYNIRQYRALFSLVSQDVVLFHDTLYNNIVMGLPDVTENEVVEAAKVANIYDFIMTLPDGFQHSLADRGLNLSGGQRQRISIARAVLHNTPILILDEATSAMDTESERAVQAALDNVMQNRTVLVVAHRLSTVQHADRIVVLDQGRIVEQGRHEELLARGGAYSRMVGKSLEFREGEVKSK